MARAILEHHERCDGSGYPMGKNDEHLDMLGQVVGIVDSIQSIRVHQFEPCGRNVRDLLPYFQMNATTHFYDVYKAVSSLIKTADLEPTVIDPSADVAGLATILGGRGVALKEAVNIVDQRRVPELTRKVKKDSKSVSLCKVANHVLTMAKQSGLVSDDILQWLSGLQDNPDAGALVELNEIELMHNELHWQLKNSFRVFEAFFEHNGTTDVPEHATLRGIAGDLDACLQKFGK
jgi:hypothetical protein